MLDRLFQRGPNPTSGLGFELLESRICCAQVPASLVVDVRGPQDVVTLDEGSAPDGASAGNQPDAVYAREILGLKGSGQTVAVIDTGIAYDHVALGGGMGRGFRVVGGWDFAEQDSTPYDDAPGGMHGTHVAGVVGSDDTRYPGLAPQVDLVALRVFDDQGRTSLGLVEQALRWVHQHRGSFRYPITVVNISMGTAWNSGNVPGWGNLEDELSQLSRDEILVTAAAGNDFAVDPRIGLTYPAASPYALPVGSLTGAGPLSAFSQRHPRMIAATGEWLTSTVPDYLFGFDGVTDDFLAMNGTSVAAPVVAGASVLLREAMQLTGFPTPTSDRVRGILMGTAQSVYDPITRLSYKKLDLRAALQSLLPPDEMGSAGSPLDVGRLRGGLEYSGVLHDVHDRDDLRFHADQSGRVTVSLQWQGHAGQRPVLMGQGSSSNGVMELQVEAGQTYSLSVRAHGGIGRYGLTIQTATPPTAPSQAPSQSTAETRWRWTAEGSGWQIVTAAFTSPNSVDSFSVRTSTGQSLVEVLRPLPVESVSIQVVQGRVYEFVSAGQNAGAVLSLSGAGGRGTSPTGGWANDCGLAVSSRDIHGVATRSQSQDARPAGPFRQQETPSAPAVVARSLQALSHDERAADHWRMESIAQCHYASSQGERESSFVAALDASLLLDPRMLDPNTWHAFPVVGQTPRG